MLTVEELSGLVTVGEIHTVVVGFTDHYGRLMGKRFDAGFFLDDCVHAGTHGCDYLLTVDMEMEPMPGFTFANWERGYGDVHLVPDMGTLRRAAWADHAALVLCDVVDGTTHEPVTVAPRSILKAQIERAEALGYRAEAASELEFFLYRDSYRAAHQKGYSDLEPAGWYIEDYHLLQGARVDDYVGAARRALGASGVPVENSKGEFGLGQHELNIRYAPLLEMADRHTVMKHGMKELADRLGVSVSFMAKPHTDQAGSSCHVHLSLWEGDGNAFGTGDGHGDMFRWFLGGWMAHAADLMVCYAPTVNSYKRYQDQSWAPTRVAWSTDNRTAGFRVVGTGASRRIECRIPGADANPYLAYAAALASGLDGIARRIEPPEELLGDAYLATDLPTMPATLREAVTRFRGSGLAEAAFGPEVVAHYAHHLENELAAYDSAVTDWERARYFERI